MIDKATVRIYYESRFVKLSLNEAELPKVDSEFEEITEGEEVDRQQKLKTRWAAMDSDGIRRRKDSMHSVIRRRPTPAPVAFAPLTG